MVRVLTAPEDWNKVKVSLGEAGYSIDDSNSGLEMIPVAYSEGSETDQESLQALLDRILELDDVDAVYHNFKLAGE